MSDEFFQDFLINADKSLDWMVFPDMGITKIPSEIGNFKQLKTLDLSDNEISELPQEIGNLENLNTLIIARNNLTSLPPEIGNLPVLRKLDVNGNLLTTLPKEISQIVLLKEILANFNQITSLPIEIRKLTLLEKIELDGNPVEQPPPEIIARGVQTIQNYFWQIETVGTDTLYEAKLLIVGEPGAGKTTLANKVMNPDYELPVEVLSASTQGIDIMNWAFTTNNGKTFRVNIWDFGGQEIYHSTHQFFLTKRSLYTLVADTRKQDTDFFYWLHVVDLLSDSSPVIILKNEKEDLKRHINERRLRSLFLNLEKVFETNLAKNRGLLEFVNEIKHQFQVLPHVGTVLPTTWLQVRETLEKDDRDYINFHEFQGICEQCGFSDREDVLQLSNFLHDIGVILHFQDDPVLKNWVILNPEWGTHAVYKLLSSKNIINNYGRFLKEDLREVWKEDKYDGMYDELLQLMKNFNLCYSIPLFSENVFIVPQLLSENQPRYSTMVSDKLVNNIQKRFSYNFLPKGLITELIVALHNNIFDQNYVWKNGVVIRSRDTYAEIMEYYDLGELHIRVGGALKRDLMAIITSKLEEIHSRYPPLSYNELIPCNCSVCVNSDDPYFYKYESLNRRKLKGILDIQCDKSFEFVNVTSLMEGNIPSIISQYSYRMKPTDVKVLYEKLRESFNLDELRELCFYLDIDFDELPGNSKSQKLIQLILLLTRREELWRLEKYIRKHRLID